MTALDVPSHGFEQTAAAEPSHAVAAVCSSPQEVTMKGNAGTPLGTLIRVRLGLGGGAAEGSKILAARRTR